MHFKITDEWLESVISSKTVLRNANQEEFDGHHKLMAHELLTFRKGVERARLIEEAKELREALSLSFSSLPEDIAKVESVMRKWGVE